MTKFIRVVQGKVMEKGETDEVGFARYQKAHPGEYRVDDKDMPLDPIPTPTVIPSGPPDHCGPPDRAPVRVKVERTLTEATGRGAAKKHPTKRSAGRNKAASKRRVPVQSSS
jgi:hypothetical protein